MNNNKLLGLEIIRFISALAVLLYHYQLFFWIKDKPIGLVIDNLPFYNLNHPVKQFYTNTQDNIAKLVSRNKTRLLKELSESKELVKLLGKSTQNELSFEEKKKVKKQLLDICKSIPSLTIFLLPGGGLLLPILIKYIPQLLPSAFNENLND